MAHDDPTRRIVMKTLAKVGVDAEASPDDRLGKANRAVYQSQLEKMMEALRPLPVGLDENGEEGVVEIVGRLGEGGMGIVELAVQRSLGREVALKRLIDPPDDPREGYPLLDEARILGGLEHPNIVPVHAVGIDPEVGPVVLLKRVQGVSWAEEIYDDADLLPGDARTLEKHLRILMQVCNALHFAHSKGILHRDVKPANVMLGAYGEVYLLDWGLALDTSTERYEPPAIAGTASYMAPEMVDGDVRSLDVRTDVYLVGATLHEVLTGEPRHPGEKVLSCLTRAAMSKPAKYPPEVPSELAAICNAACAKDKNARFPSVDHLRAAVAKYIDRRESYTLLKAAHRALETAKAVPDKATRSLYEARFAAEQALRTTPGLNDAKRIRARCLHAMIRHEAEHGNIRGAQGLVEELDGKLPESIAALIEHKQAEAEQERERISMLERDIDPELSRKQRLVFSAFGLVSLIVYHAVLYLWFPPSEGDLSALVLMISGVVLTAPLGVVLVAGLPKFRETAIGRQFGWILATCLLGFLVARSLGWFGDLSMAMVFSVECAAVAMVPLAVDVPLRGRVVMGIAGLVAAIACAVFPDYARQIHTVWHLSMMGVAVVDNAVPAEREAHPEES